MSNCIFAVSVVKLRYSINTSMNSIEIPAVNVIG
jgi:hypothetical protein